MKRKNNEGNIIILVLVLSIVMFMAISVLKVNLTEESQQTGNLVKEIKATYIGEAVANQIVSLVSRRPWEERFYLAQAKMAFGAGAPPVPIWSFDQDGFPFDGSGPTIWGKDIEYVGTVKDLDIYQRTFRIYVEVTYLDHKVTLSSDKRYEEDFLGSLNNEASDMSKKLDLPISEQVRSDERLEKIKEEAANLDKILAGAGDKLTTLQNDKVEYTKMIGLAPELMVDTSRIK